MSQARAGIGTLLQLGTGSPVTYTTIAAVHDINGPSLSAKTYDVTTHDNPLQGYADFITGLKDGGEITTKVFFDATDDTHKDLAGGLLGSFNANTAIPMKAVPAGYVSPAPSWTFNAVVTKLNFKYPVDGAQETDVTFKVKGKPVLA